MDLPSAEPAAASAWATISTCPSGRAAAKTYAWKSGSGWELRAGYTAGSRFEFQPWPLADTAEVERLLRTLQRRSRIFIVRGRLTEAFHDRQRRGQLSFTHVRRTRDHGDGNVPTLEDAPNALLTLDSDDFAIPGGLTIENDAPEIARRFIHEKLPPEFHNAACVVQLSSSAGLLPGRKFKAHLFFLAARGVTMNPLARYLRAHAPKTEGGADTATLRPAQPIYTAAPILLPEGMPDPLGERRVFVIEGVPRVPLPSDEEMERVALAARLPAELPPPGRARGAARPWRTLASATTGRPLDIEDTLRACRTPQAALALVGDDNGRAGFHQPLLWAAWLAARGVVLAGREGSATDVARARFVADAEAAITTAPRAAGRDVAEYDAPYLRRIFDGALAQISNRARDVRARWKRQDARERLPVGTARLRLAERLLDTLAQTRAWLISPGETTPVVGLKATVGLGKTEALVRELANHVAMARALDLPHRVVVFVPTHRLGGELEARLRDASVAVATWRGLDADDPAAPDGAKMCRNPTAAKAAIEAGLPVARAACGPADGKSEACPFRSDCAWWRQRSDARSADVVVAAGASAFGQLDPALQRGVGLFVFDEAWWQAGLSEEVVSLDYLGADAEAQPVLGRRGRLDAEATATLHGMRRRLLAVLDAAGEGRPLPVAALRRAGLSAFACHETARLEWRRRPPHAPIRPGMTRKELAAALEAPGAREAALIARTAGVWNALAEALSGPPVSETACVVVARKGSAEGAVRVVRIRSRRRLAKPIRRRPVLLLDATLPAGIVREWFGQLDVHEVSAAAPHQRVTLIPGPFGKSSLAPHPSAGPDEARRREARLGELRDIVCALGRDGPTLAITNKDLVGAFGELPDVDVAHFNAIAGRDSWGAVRHLAVIGAPTPAPDAVAKVVAQLRGAACSTDSEMDLAAVEMRNGSLGLVQARRYRDPAAEEVRAAITDAELLQAIGRGRGVNRTAETPLDVWLFAAAAPPGLVADQILPWDDVRPSTVDRMALRGAFFESAADAAAVWPDLFPSPAAAKKAIQRASRSDKMSAANCRGGAGRCGLKGTFRCEYLSIGECPLKRHFVGTGTAFARARYRASAHQRGERIAWIAPPLLGSARAQIEAALGPLDFFTVEGGAASTDHPCGCCAAPLTMETST